MIIYPNGAPVANPHGNSAKTSTEPVTAGKQVVVRQNIPDGNLGAKFTMNAMKDIVWSYGCKDVHAAILRKLTAGCTTDKCRIDAVYQWVNKIVKYTPDPPDEELVKSPCRIFNEVQANGIATGDCDDLSVLIAASFKLLGMQTGFEAVSNGTLIANRNAPLDHVFAIVYDRERHMWVGVDPVAPSKSWEGHKQLIDLIGNEPPLYAVVGFVKSMYTGIMSALKPQEAKAV